MSEFIYCVGGAGVGKTTLCENSIERFTWSKVIVLSHPSDCSKYSSKYQSTSNVTCVSVDASTFDESTFNQTIQTILSTSSDAVAASDMLVNDGMLMILDGIFDGLTQDQNQSLFNILTQCYQNYSNLHVISVNQQWITDHPNVSSSVQESILNITTTLVMFGRFTQHIVEKLPLFTKVDKEITLTQTRYISIGSSTIMKTLSDEIYSFSVVPENTTSTSTSSSSSSSSSSSTFTSSDTANDSSSSLSSNSDIWMKTNTDTTCIIM